MFKRYANDIHTTFKKKNDHQRNMFTKSVSNIQNSKHVLDLDLAKQKAKGVVDKINSLEK